MQHLGEAGVMLHQHQVAALQHPVHAQDPARHHPAGTIGGVRVADDLQPLAHRHLPPGQDAQHPLDVVVRAGPLHVGVGEALDEGPFGMPGRMTEAHVLVDPPPVGGHVAGDDLAIVNADALGGLDVERGDDQHLAVPPLHVVVVLVLEHLPLEHLAPLPLPVSPRSFTAPGLGGWGRGRPQHGPDDPLAHLEPAADKVDVAVLLDGGPAGDEVHGRAQLLAQLDFGRVLGDGLHQVLQVAAGPGEDICEGFGRVGLEKLVDVDLVLPLGPG